MSAVLPRSTAGRGLATALATTALAIAGLAVATPTSAHASGWGRCVDGTEHRQAVFHRAAAASGVPESVLLAVSFMESRWDVHGSSPSTSGGYGPMDLTALPAGVVDPAASAKADGVVSRHAPVGTLAQAASLTGLSRSLLKANAAANICGGAAVLASYQPHTTSASPRAWSTAVARFSGARDQGDAARFAHEVFSVLRNGTSRTTDDGQRVTMAAVPSARFDTAVLPRLGLKAPASSTSGVTDCPPTLACQWVPAPYAWYGAPNPYAYGNHDIADRPNDLKIRYIVIHDTESSYAEAMNLVQDPTYLGWNYTIRSSDGHVAQHLNAQDVGWHAGNWYVNMHSIGVEHEGYAAQGATWYTEALYRSSAALVRYLAHEYDVPLDRAHIIGHDQVPGITPPYVAGMHWDPGPYWDWEHYMSLLGAPLRPDHTAHSDVVTVAPHFADNPQPVTGCDSSGSGNPCPTQGTNFVYLHTAPSESAPLVSDVGLHPGGGPSTTDVADIGARVDAGQKLVVAQRAKGWLGVWYLGAIGWMKSDNAAGQSVTLPSSGTLVRAAGSSAVPVYGRAYPEQSAYPSAIPYQTVTPLQYTIKPGQAYVLADRDVSTDYYYAQTFDNAVADDHTVVRGKDTYYQIWFGHRIAYVRAADVTLSAG